MRPDEPIPDFHEVLGIAPGCESGLFVLRMWDILKLDGMGCEWRDVVAESVEALGLQGSPDFLTMLAAMERVDGVPYDGTPADLQRHDGVLETLLMVLSRRDGSTPVPPAWTRDGMVASMPSGAIEARAWEICLFDGVSCHLGQSTDFEKNPYFISLRGLTAALFGSDASREEAAMLLSDTIGGFCHDGEWGAVIDALRLVDELPPGHLRVARILDEHALLASPIPGVRFAASKLAARRSVAPLTDTITASLCAETYPLIAREQVRALRQIGGTEGFDALLDAARTAVAPEASKIAARALAWVQHYPQCRTRVNALLFDDDPDVENIGAAALSDAKHHSVFDYGDAIATEQEVRLRDDFFDLMEERCAAEQLRRLSSAFESGEVSILTGPDAASAGIEEDGAVVVTPAQVVVLKLRPKHIEHGRRCLARVCDAIPF